MNYAEEDLGYHLCDVSEMEVRSGEGGKRTKVP